MTRPSKRMIAALLTMIVIGAWTAAFAYLWIGSPTTAQWAAAVTAAAVISEIALWIAVAGLGLTALDKLRIWRQFRKPSGED